MEHCRSPDGITSISVRLYYTMLSRVYLALAMGFLVPYAGLLERILCSRKNTHILTNNVFQFLKVFLTY